MTQFDLPSAAGVVGSAMWIISASSPGLRRASPALELPHLVRDVACGAKQRSHGVLGDQRTDRALA